MKGMKLVLQGGGRMTLVAEPGIRPEEFGALKQALKAHEDDGAPITMFGGIDEIIDNRPLNERNVTPIVTRDRSSGKYHERYVVVQVNGNERIVVDERCQADQSGKYDVLEAVPESADRNTLCYYCYPPVEVEREPTAGPI
jgi:hypothetical protein